MTSDHSCDTSIFKFELNRGKKRALISKASDAITSSQIGKLVANFFKDRLWKPLWYFIWDNNLTFTSSISQIFWLDLDFLRKKVLLICCNPRSKMLSLSFWIPLFSHWRNNLPWGILHRLPKYLSVRMRKTRPKMIQFPRISMLEFTTFYI